MVKYTNLKQFVIVILLSIQTGLNAQSRLSLCYRLEVIPKIESYYNSFDSILQARLGDDYLFRFTVEPSFEPEYALQIEFVEKQYYLKVISFDKNLWYAKDVANINIDERTIEMSTELAEQVLYISKHFIADKMDSVSIEIKDGDLYQFELKEKETNICGQIVGPAFNSPLGKMCRVCNRIKDICLTDSKSVFLMNEEIIILIQKSKIL